MNVKIIALRYIDCHKETKETDMVDRMYIIALRRTAKNISDKPAH